MNTLRNGTTYLSHWNRPPFSQFLYWGAWQQEIEIATWNATNAQEFGKFPVSKVALEKSSSGRSSSNTLGPAWHCIEMLKNEKMFSGQSSLNKLHWKRGRTSWKISILETKVPHDRQSSRIILRCSFWTLPVELHGMDLSEWSLVLNLAHNKEIAIFFVHLGLKYLQKFRPSDRLTIHESPSCSGQVEISYLSCEESITYQCLQTS